MLTKKRYIRKQREKLMEIFVMTTLMTFGVMIVLIVSHLYVNYSLNKNQKAIEAISKDLAVLQEKIDSTKAQEIKYKNELEELQIQLSKYQAIVIPESMNSDSN